MERRRRDDAKRRTAGTSALHARNGAEAVPSSRFGRRLRRQEGKLSRDCFAAMWGVQQNVTECIRFEERNPFEGTGPPFPAAVQENGQVRRKRPGQGGFAGIAGVGRKASASVRRGMRDGRGQSSFFLTDTRLTTCA